jgi:hypothetical protein
LKSEKGVGKAIHHIEPSLVKLGSIREQLIPILLRKLELNSSHEVAWLPD